MDIEQDLMAIVRKKATGTTDIDSNTKLADIGLDSLDFVEIVFEIEDKFQIQLPQNDEQMSSATFNDLCRLVEQQIARGGGALPEAQPA